MSKTINTNEEEKRIITELQAAVNNAQLLFNVSIQSMLASKKQKKGIKITLDKDLNFVID